MTRTVLLDTHVLLWVLADDPRLGGTARALMASAVERLVSAASLWELAIKSELGKVSVPPDLPARTSSSGMVWLPVGPEHGWGVRSITGLVHSDPFDRLLLAQASHERAAFVTADAAILGATLSPEVERLDARR